MNDLFEHPELLPKQVKEVLDKHTNMDNDYESCEKLVIDLNAVGYTCEYYLDAEPYDLRKMTDKEIEEYENLIGPIIRTNLIRDMKVTPFNLIIITLGLIAFFSILIYLLSLITE